MSEEDKIIEQCKRVICSFLRENASYSPQALANLIEIRQDNKELLLEHCYALKELVDTSIDILEKEQEEIENFKEMREQAEMEAKEE